jgi:tetratricopeptide (TPR) repeat protein
MNTDRFEQFEFYLSGTMSSEEKALFEAELSADQELHTTFEVYRTIETEMRGREQNSIKELELRESLQTLNAQYFNAGPQARIIPFYTHKVYRWAIAVAAMLTIGVFSYITFFRQSQDSRELAAAYYDENLTQLSQTMDATRDSLQLGIAAYNNKDFAKALSYFEAIYSRHPEHSEALKNAGIAHLAAGDYEKALNSFEQLSAMKDLYANPGDFLSAVTLLLRDGKGDKETARQLLERIVKEKAEGSREAEEWLKGF